MWLISWGESYDLLSTVLDIVILTGNSHPEYLEVEDDDGDVELKDPEDDATAQTNGVPEVSQFPRVFANGEQTK